MAGAITIWSDFIITDNGLNLRQAAIGLGCKVDFVYAEIGEGVPSDPSQIPLMTALVQFTQRTAIALSAVSGPTHFIDLLIDNKEYTEPILWRELAVFAKLIPPETSLDNPIPEVLLSPVLYGYAYTTQGYESIPAGTDFHRTWSIGIDTKLSRSTSIIISYDGSKVYATIEALGAVTAQLNGHVNRIISAENGVHGIRVKGGILQFFDGIGWVFVDAANEIRVHNTDPNAHYEVIANLQRQIDLIMDMLSNFRAGKLLDSDGTVQDGLVHLTESGEIMPLVLRKKQ